MFLPHHCLFSASCKVELFRAHKLWYILLPRGSIRIFDFWKDPFLLGLNLVCKAAWNFLLTLPWKSDFLMFRRHLASDPTISHLNDHELFYFIQFSLFVLFLGHAQLCSGLTSDCSGITFGRDPGTIKGARIKPCLTAQKAGVLLAILFLWPHSIPLWPESK